MNIKIGENIKRLRTERGITQERLAEVLGVSTVAVSKWERGETMPDISFLPHLAYFFETTIDDLLSYDACAVDLSIKAFVDEHTKNASEGKWDICRELSAEAMHNFPNDYRVMELYMWDIIGGYADNEAEAVLGHREELEHLCEKILDGCRDAYIRRDAVVMKGKLLHAAGLTDEALTLYRQELPDWYQTAGQKSEQLFNKNTPEFASLLHENIMELSRFLLNKISKKIWFCEDGSIKEKEEKVSEICRILKGLETVAGIESIETLIEYFKGDFACKVNCFVDAD